MFRRRRLGLLVLAGTLIAVLAAVLGTSGGAPSTGPTAGHGASTRTGSSSLTLMIRPASWRLPAALSGEVALTHAGQLVLVGGLDGSGTSASGIFAVDPQTGRTRQLGSLAAPVHDAAGAVVGGQALVFGGGASATTAAVQAFPFTGKARIVGQLPARRSDLDATVLAGRAYLVGGYDGARPLATVLASADGQRFAPVAQLPVPVRYPALAGIGHTLYVFGGEQANGHDTNAVQAIGVNHSTARVVGHLPATLAHASAATLAGRIYLLGGRADGTTTDQVWRFDPTTGKATRAGRLPAPIANAATATVGDTAYLAGGLDPAGHAVNTVATLRLQRVQARQPARPASTAPKAAAAAPFQGRLLIADRGNNRLLLVDAHKRVLWRYPSASRPAPPGGFYFPDDAFFVRHGTGIISNEEDNNAIVQIGFPSGRLLWSYGHTKTAGSGPGYLNQPDDAYLLSDGNVTVADAKNCRILIISPQRQPIRQIGTNGDCTHHPPTGIAYPNGDTPLANGDLLISEINGSHVSEYTRHGTLVWSVKLPLAYPSDPQQLGPDRYLIADYHRPGGLYEFDRTGRILWSYHPDHGPGMLDHPSLAERLPNGLIAVNDDYRDRVVLIDPHTRRIVWQYGHTDQPGSGPDRLKIPDGFDLLQAGGRTPTHPHTG